MNEIFKDASGFIFDCDGTLLDTMGAWNQLEKRMFSQARIPFTEEEIDAVRALPIQLAAGIFHEHGIAESPEGVLEILDTALLNFYCEEVEALPGALEFVCAARDNNIPCCIVSSSPQRYVVSGMQRVGLADAFCRIITTEDVNLSKQDVGIYEFAVETMHSKAETTWGFDDALYALKVMREAGLRTCGCYDHDETGTFDQLTEVADVAIRSFNELL